MSGDVSAARRPGASRPAPAAPDPLARRRTRLAVVVGVAAALVATGVTGAGLLVPGGADTPALRLGGAALALAAGGALVRLEGAARGATTLAIVAGTAALTCLATFPASPVVLGGAGATDAGSAPTDGDGTFGSPGEGESSGGDAGSGGPGALVLPPGADVRIDGGDVVLGLPDGAQVVIGRADAADPAGLPGADTGLAVVDGVVTRGDGGPVGPGAPLGGTTFERSDGGRVVVGDGRLLDVPPPLPEADADDLDALLALLLGCFALVAFAPPVIRVTEHRAPSLLDDSESDGDEPSTVEATTVEDGLAEVLRSMLADPDPRTAVIGAYGRLLTALAEAGAPRRDEEGPHEHLWRSLGPLGVRRAPLHRLAELFVRARFTPHPVTETHRQAAIAALADAVADLRLPASDVAAVAADAGVAGEESR